MKMIIEGDPRPQGRIRFSRGRGYYLKADRQYRDKIKASAKAAMEGKAPLTCEICAAIKLYRKYKRTARQYGDVDNHLKAIFDGLAGIVFADDRQIVRCVVEKFTDKENPRVEIEIAEVES